MIVPAGVWVSVAFSQETVMAVFEETTRAGALAGWAGASAIGKVTTALSADTPWEFVALYTNW